jgi:hypothetical protein
MTNDATTAKNRSYRVAEQIADDLGAPRYTAGLTVARYADSCEVEFADGVTAYLRNTSNAGFRGIEGYCQETSPEGDLTGRTFTRSLGEVTAWTVA